MLSSVSQVQDRAGAFGIKKKIIFRAGLNSSDNIPCFTDK